MIQTGQSTLTMEVLGSTGPRSSQSLRLGVSPAQEEQGMAGEELTGELRSEQGNQRRMKKDSFQMKGPAC